MSLPTFLPHAQATYDLGYGLGKVLPGGSVLLLQGNLGVGKTTLVQGLGAGLGIAAPIVSPTFILLCEYPEGRIPLYHFDLYRLSPEEAEQLQVERYWEGEEVEPGIVVVEWSDRLTYKPPDYVELTLTHLATGGREVQWRLEGHDDRGALVLCERCVTASPNTPYKGQS